MKVLTALIVITVIESFQCLPLKFSVTKLTRTVKKLWKDDSTNYVFSKPVIHTRMNKQLIDPTESWSNCRAIRIKPGSRCNFLIVDTTTNIVRGTTKRRLEKGEGVFQIESYGKSIVRLKDMTTNQYLLMNRKGHIDVTKDSSSEESLFRHILEEKTYMDTFASMKYYMKPGDFDLFLGIRSQKKFNCRTKNGKRTRPDQLSNQFYLDTKNIDQSKYCKKAMF